MDMFRVGGLDFRSWVGTFNLENLPGPDRERFLASLGALESNSALTFLLNRLEAEALNFMALAPRGDLENLSQAQADLAAVRRLQALIKAAGQDRRLDVTKVKK